MFDHRTLHHPNRHNFKSRNQLQLVEIGYRNLPTIESRFRAEIEERGYGHLGQLGERIVDRRLLQPLGYDRATARADQQNHNQES